VSGSIFKNRVSSTVLMSCADRLQRSYEVRLADFAGDTEAPNAFFHEQPLDHLLSWGTGSASESSEPLPRAPHDELPRKIGEPAGPPEGAWLVSSAHRKDMSRRFSIRPPIARAKSKRSAPSEWGGRTCSNSAPSGALRAPVLLSRGSAPEAPDSPRLQLVGVYDERWLPFRGRRSRAR